MEMLLDHLVAVRQPKEMIMFRERWRLTQLAATIVFIVSTTKWKT